MEIYRSLECGGFETKESETLLDGWKLYPSHEERVETLKSLYDYDEVAEVLGYYDGSMDEEEFKMINQFENVDARKFVNTIYNLGADNGNFEESILLKEPLAI